MRADKLDLETCRLWTDVSVKFMENNYQKRYDRNWDLYENKHKGRMLKFIETKDETDILWINQFYPNIELMKASIFFNNPRIYVKSVREDSQQKAFAISDYLNWLNYNINTKHVLCKVRDDAIVSNFGVCMVYYNTDVGVGKEPDDIYIKSESIALEYIYPKDFGVDPDCTDPYEFTDARFVRRSVVVPVEYARDRFNIRKLEPTRSAYGKVNVGSRNEKARFQEASVSDRVVLHELWIKPSPMERREGLKGRVIVIADGYTGNSRNKGFLANDVWKYDMEGYPFSGIRLNDRNDNFYSISDIEQYYDQVEEQSLLRTFQLENAQHSSKIKEVLSIDQIDPQDREDFRDGTPRSIFVSGDARTAASYYTPGSVSSEFYRVDQKVKMDTDELSGINDLRRGVSTGVDTATEASLIAKTNSLRFSTRLDKFVDLYTRVQRKFIQLAQQFVDQDKAIPIMNDPERAGQFRTISKEEIQGEYDIRVQVSEMAPMNQETQIAKIQNVFNQYMGIASNPIIMQQFAQQGITFDLKKLLLEFQHLLDLDSLEIVKVLNPLEAQGLEATMQNAQGGEAGTNEVALNPSLLSESIRQSEANKLGAKFRGTA